MSKNKPAIVIFSYNRHEHLRQMLETLKQCRGFSSFDYFFFCDGPKHSDDVPKIESVKQVISDFSVTSKTVNYQEVNRGLATSVIAGVSEVIKNYGSVIVFEDDLLLHPATLEFFEDSLTKYQNDSKVFSIGGFNYPIPKPFWYREEVYASVRCCSWGWATWADRWEKINWDRNFYAEKYKDKDFMNKYLLGGDDLPEILLGYLDGRYDSWAIRFDVHHVLSEAWCVRPISSLIRNTGFDGSGTNCGPSDAAEKNRYWPVERAPVVPARLKINQTYLQRFKRITK